MRRYELYHDESKEYGYWHGMLLVPVERKAILLEYLECARSNTQYTKELGLKKVKKESSKIYRCAQAWLQVAVGAFMYNFKGKPYPLDLGKCVKGKKQYDLFSDLIRAKFILFREKDNLANMIGHKDYGSKVETTFRMGLKGGLHFLGAPERPMTIEKLHFDGHEHYGRNLDRTRIVERLGGLRDYCAVSDISDIIDDRSSDHDRTDSQSYEDCQLLQLTDLLVGSFRTILGCSTRPAHQTLAYPVKTIIEKYHEGVARMRYSRWRESFCISQCYLQDSRWYFETIDYEAKSGELQQELF
jgi:hypothetical protein